MDRQPVSSRAVVSVGYDCTDEELEIEFKSGRIYRYFGVPQSEHDALLAADSIGEFVNTRIKGRYLFLEVYF